MKAVHGVETTSRPATAAELVIFGNNPGFVASRIRLTYNVRFPSINYR
jgi:hypothetical protein